MGGSFTVTYTVPSTDSSCDSTAITNIANSDIGTCNSVSNFGSCNAGCAVGYSSIGSTTFRCLFGSLIGRFSCHLGNNKKK
jgi:hypothetical protein